MCTRKDKKKLAHMLMVLLVISWGFEYICAKAALEVVPSLTLVSFKCLIGLMVVFCIKIRIDPKGLFRKKDILLLVACAIMGEIMYFFCEYEAMGYMPISLITVLLAFVPAVSILIEVIVYRRKPTYIMIIAVILGILGVAMIIGADISIFFKGRLWGYLFCLGAILAWNCYNFLTSRLTKNYNAITLTFNQLICTILLTLPYAFTHLPPSEHVTWEVVGGVLYLGIVSAGIGFSIYVFALNQLGPTNNAVYSNFLPVSATLFGWIFLKEVVSPIQILGGILVISTGYMVIREKNKLTKRETLKK